MNKNYMLVVLYLVAIVLANLSVTYFGAVASIYNALILIAFDLTARDGLHELWKNNNLWLKMFILIATGSLISYMLNSNAMIIAIASLSAFAMAGFADTVIYYLLEGKHKLIKMNGSNVVSGTIDTAVFVIIAGLPLWVIPAQIIAKIVGGAFWSVVISKLSFKSVLTNVL